MNSKRVWNWHITIWTLRKFVTMSPIWRSITATFRKELGPSPLATTAGQLAVKKKEEEQIFLFEFFCISFSFFGWKYWNVLVLMNRLHGGGIESWIVSSKWAIHWEQTSSGTNLRCSESHSFVSERWWRLANLWADALWCLARIFEPLWSFWFVLSFFFFLSHIRFRLLDDIMVDYSYVELSSTSIRTLLLFQKHFPDHRTAEIK